MVENIKWYKHYGEQLKTELPDDPAMVLQSIYPKEFKARSQRDIGMLMFAAALLTIIAKRWGQLKCPSILNRKRKFSISIRWNISLPFTKKKTLARMSLKNI